MAKVKGPMLSTRAYGTIGNSLIFHRDPVNDNNVVSGYCLRNDPRTEAQRYVRKQFTIRALAADKLDHWALEVLK